MLLSSFAPFNPLVGLASSAANMANYFTARKRQDGQGKRQQWGGKRRQYGGRAIPYNVDANGGGDPMVRYDPTATIGVPAPTAVARVTGKPEIEYRGAEKIQTAMKQTIDYEVNPQTSIVQDGNIEFFYPGTDCYVDLNNTYMLLQLKLVKADGTAVGAWTEAFSGTATSPLEDATTAVINYLPATMWKSVTTEIGGVVVTKPHNYYAYNAYVDAMLAYTKEYKGTRLGLSVVSEPDTFSSYGDVQIHRSAP